MNKERIFQVLLAPQVSEKASMAIENNQYVFRVRNDATKPEIKTSVEQLFDVKVKGVQTLNMKGKTKRFGRGMGRRSDWKKAYVTLKEGFEIENLGAE